MKSVRSVADATRDAARLGASLEVNGRVINSSGSKLQLLRSKSADKPAPDPAPPPPEPADNGQVAELARLLREQSDRQQQTMLAVLESLQMRAAPEPPPMPLQAPVLRPTSFKVLRDGDGRATALVPIYGPGQASRPDGFTTVKDKDGRVQSFVPKY